MLTEICVCWCLWLEMFGNDYGCYGEECAIEVLPSMVMVYSCPWLWFIPVNGYGLPLLQKTDCSTDDIGIL